MIPILRQPLPETNLTSGCFVQTKDDVVLITPLNGRAGAVSLKYGHRIGQVINHPGMKRNYTLAEAKAILGKAIVSAYVINAAAVSPALVGMQVDGKPVINRPTGLEPTNVRIGSVVLHLPTNNLYMVVRVVASDGKHHLALQNFNGHTFYNNTDSLSFVDGFVTEQVADRLFHRGTNQWAVMDRDDLVAFFSDTTNGWGS